MTDDDLADDRAALLQVLRGQRRGDDDDPFFRDDLFYFLVQRVEHRDLSWLVQQLHDAAFDPDGRGLIVMNLSAERRQPLLPLLRALIESAKPAR